MENASLQWRNEQPFCQGFDDIYFSSHHIGDSFAETIHVFIKGNQLPTRFSTLDDPSSGGGFSICELGFGTGLNILALCDQWDRRGHKNGHLHLVSIEGYPLHLEDFIRTQNTLVAQKPALKSLSTRLIEAYPPAMRGQYVIALAHDITLTLIWDEVGAALENLEAQFDAWLLDGFSPAKNPAMWTGTVFREIARLSHTRSTAATFTVAGLVKRGLREAGYTIFKQPGFGRKREMLAASKSPPPPAHHPASHSGQFPQSTSFSSQQRVLIIGAGIAGSALAYHLKRLGATPILMEKIAPASGASGNPVGLIMPRLDLPTSPACHFYKQAYLYTLRFIEGFADQTLFKAIGAEKRPKDLAEKERHQALAQLPALPASDITLSEGGHLYFPRAGLVYPAALITRLIRHIAFIKDTATHYQKTVSGWRVYGEKTHYSADIIVITAGVGSIQLYDDPAKSLYASRGQIDLFNTPQTPERIISQGQYCAPYTSGSIIAGATYEDVIPETGAYPSLESTQENQHDAARLLDIPPHGLTPQLSRASLRCAARDYDPISGPLPAAPISAAHAKIENTSQEGQFILSGLGSRGLVTAPYLADDLARLIISAPRLLSRQERDLVTPARFIRRLVKKQDRPPTAN